MPILELGLGISCWDTILSMIYLRSCWNELIMDQTIVQTPHVGVIDFHPFPTLQNH